MQNITIGIVLPEVPGYSETFFYSKIQGLQEQGHEVILFANTNPGTFTLCKVVEAKKVNTGNFLLLSIKLTVNIISLFFKAPGVVLKFIKLEKADGTPFKHIFEKIYINAHILPQKLTWLHFGFATMALKRENVASAIKAKMAVSFRGYDISIYPAKNPGCYDKLWRKVDKIHTISDDLYKEALKLGLSEKLPMQKITPAIKVEKFLNNKKFKGFNAPLQLITVGRLNWKKGLEYAITALGLLHKRGINFNYNIIGTGIEQERLVFAAHQLGINGKINFLGKKTHDEVVTYMSDSDIYLQPSIQEGFCNAVLEAQASGLFCVVTDAEGLAENVLNGKTGWVVPKRNPKAMADKIEELINKEPQELLKVQQQAVERVKNEFNIQKQNLEFKKFYNI
jgi:colanic acid/amylovoran biosynthesis glycosyltransferase